MTYQRWIFHRLQILEWINLVIMCCNISFIYLIFQYRSLNLLHFFLAWVSDQTPKILCCLLNLKGWNFGSIWIKKRYVTPWHWPIFVLSCSSSDITCILCNIHKSQKCMNPERKPRKTLPTAAPVGSYGRLEWKSLLYESFSFSLCGCVCMRWLWLAFVQVGWGEVRLRWPPLRQAGWHYYWVRLCSILLWWPYSPRAWLEFDPCPCWREGKRCELKGRSGSVSHTYDWVFIQ